MFIMCHLTRLDNYVNLLFIFCFLLISSAQAQPAILHTGSSIQPGEALSIQGEFSGTAQVYLAVGTDSNSQQLPVLAQRTGHLAVQLPTRLTSNVYQVWVVDQGQRSASVYLNRAHGVHFDSPDITPGGSVRLFGRNLLLNGTLPQVRLVAQAGGSSGGAALVQAYDAYSLRLTAPTNIMPGQTYDIYVSNGYGGTAGETLVEQSLMAISPGTDYFKLAVPWAVKLNFYQNVYNVRTDARLSLHALGDGVVNDLPALQAAIDSASADGGGIVFIPAGTYKLALNAGGGLNMRSRVVVQGEGKDTTVLRFGYGSTGPNWNANGYWGLIWHNVNQAGLADLSMLNIDDTGNFYNNMTGQGTELFMQRIRFDLNQGSWLWWAGSSRLVISNSDFTQGIDRQAGYHGLLQLNGCQDFVIAHNTFTYAVDGLNLNNTSRGVFEDNLVNRDGSARWPLSLQLVNHVLILNFAENVAVLRNTFKVINGAAQNINDGETIIAEGGGPYRIDEDAGTVSRASATTLQDSSKNWPAMQQHPVVAIVRGPGMGQWRSITSRTANTLTLNKPWEVLPQAGSRYAIFNWGARNWLVQDNTMEGNRRGITLYENATTDVAIVGNTLTNSGSIDISPWQSDNSQNGVPQEFLPMYDTQVIGNHVADTDGSNGVFIGVHTTQYIQPSSFGTSVIGLEVRHNTLTAHQPNVLAVVDDNFPEGYLNDLHFQPGASNYADEQTPAILGSIFQDNTAINCNHAVYLNSGSYNTVVCRMNLINSPDLLQDIRLTAVEHASVATASCLADPVGTGSLAPSADPKTNPAVHRNAKMVSLLPLTGSDSNPQGIVIGFNLVSLPDTTQGTVYIQGARAMPNTWVPLDKAQMLSFQPADNYTGKFLFTYTATNNLSLSSTAATFTIPVENPLPVELVTFRAKTQATDTWLTWRTASERNTDYFAIERSIDSEHFITAGTVHSQGTAATYRFVDKSVSTLVKGPLYYRLRQVDLDSTAAYSSVQIVTFEVAAEVVHIYPNPVMRELQITLFTAGAHFWVYSAVSELVQEGSTATTQGTLDVRNLPVGLYLLAIQLKENTRVYYKFIKD